MTKEQARQAVIDAVKAWREAVCSWPRIPAFSKGRCDGDNHVMECPCEVARQDLLAAHNKLEQVGGG